MANTDSGEARVVLGRLSPEVDGGRFPAKRCVGDIAVVEAEGFVDGHDLIRVALRWRHTSTPEWNYLRMVTAGPGTDRWRGEFLLTETGEYEYFVQAWVDQLGTWRSGIEKKMDAGQDVQVDVEQGAQLVERWSSLRGRRKPAAGLASALRAAPSPAALLAITRGPEFEALAELPPPKAKITEGPVRRLTVDPLVARFGAWYEFFPRSTGPDGCHGTFRTAEAMLAYVANSGFDVVYLPPIHPIGRKNRKGPNNALRAGPADPGSPWAIGSEEGGHRALHPELGSWGDFDHFLERAKELGLHIAIDLAFQCAPDHPLIEEHPQWFRWRPDGTIAYAENPPKRYEDIVPFDFESAEWRSLWQELQDTTRFWVEKGVRIFRVDNPHTKAFAFWEWMIRGIKREFPDVLFLAEAFTRPALLHGLAKRGFSQSYNYFPWRNTRREIEEYMTELSRGPGADYLRPNLWPNTPDILTEYLQHGGRPAFAARFVLAATLGASYGIYGPAFELCENTPREPGSEEYLNSEKYQLRHWDLDSEWSLQPLVARVNALRHEHPALQDNVSLRFYETENEQLICYSKRAGDDVVITVVNLDPHYRQSGYLNLDLQGLGVDPAASYQVHDELGGGRFLWQGPRNFVALDPGGSHIFVPRRRVRTERDFDYFQ